MAFGAWEIGLLVAAVFVISCYFLIHRVPLFSFPGKHVVITGGSQGIGKATASNLVQLGASVSIIARNKQVLEEAVAELKKKAKGGAQVNGFSADVSDSKQVQAAIEAAAKLFNGRIDVLITSAGYSRPGLFEDIPESEFRRMMDVNFMGTVYATRAALPFMKKNGGRIMFVSSMAGCQGITGFSGYTPTKFALRGFAEVMHMELAPHKIAVTVVLPPDVDTPGFAEENKYKPLECKLISEGSGVFKAEDIARDIISSLQNWRFLVSTGFDGKLSTVIFTGLTPPASVAQILYEILLWPLLRYVGLFYLFNFNRITHKVFKQRQRGEVPPTGAAEKKTQ